MDSLKVCVWEAAKGALTASQQSEIEEKRRVVVEQPTAHSSRKQLEQEVAAPSKLESAYQRQHKAAVCWRKWLTMSRNRRRECSRRLWRQRW